MLAYYVGKPEKSRFLKLIVCAIQDIDTGDPERSMWWSRYIWMEIS